MQCHSGKFLEKYSTIICVVLLILAFAIRLYAAGIAVIEDVVEGDKLIFIKSISFNPSTLYLPVGDKNIENPLLSAYILKLGIAIFGEGKLGLRLFFVLFGTFSLFFIYKLVKGKLDVTTALLCLYLLTFSQLHIGMSRLASEHVLLFLFVSAAMYAFFQAVDTQKPKYIYVLAVLLGVGCLNYQWMSLLAPVFLLFLIIQKEYRFWFKRKELYFAGLLAFALVLPFLIWSYADGFTKLSSENVFDLGFSLRSFYLFFGEIFAWLTERTGFFIWGHDDGGAFALMGGRWHLWVDGSNELPFIHWVLGAFMFIGYIYHVRKKNNNDLIKFCLIMFTFVFVFTSVIAGADTIFDDHWWAEMTIFPGVILCAHMLVEFQKKVCWINIVIVGLITYSLVHAIYFVNLPEHQYAVPKEYLQKWYLAKAELYLQENKKNLAIDRCRWVLARAKNKMIIKSANTILSEAR